MMFGVDVKLVLFPLVLIAAQVEAEGPCCFSKKLGGKSFTLIESNSNEVTTKGCDTANNCIYEEDVTKKRYCFKRGGQEIPKCLQALPPLPTCTDYYAMADLDKTVDSDQSITTGTLNPNCTAPNITSPSDLDFKDGKLFPLGNDLVLLDYKYSTTRQQKMKKLEAGAWTDTPFKAGTSFSNERYSIASYNNVLYAMGGVLGPAISKEVYKSVDGFTWEKLTWELTYKHADAMSCITKNDENGHASLVVTAGMVTDSFYPNTVLEIYDLEAANPGADNFKSINSVPYGENIQSPDNQIVCHNGWVHVAIDAEKKVYSWKLSNPVNGKFKENAYAQHTDKGKFIIYQDKVGLVGGKNTKGADLENILILGDSGFDAAAGPAFPWYKEATAARDITFISKQ